MVIYNLALGENSTSGLRHKVISIEKRIEGFKKNAYIHIYYM